MTDLHGLAYVSSASFLLNQDELDAVLRVSRARNGAAGITGLLLYCDGSVMQYLEGPRTAVRATFARIAEDPRHRDLIVLLDEPVAKREFSDWSMACSRVDPPDFARLRAAPWPALSTAAERQGLAMGLLSSFWRNLGGVALSSA